MIIIILLLIFIGFPCGAPVIRQYLVGSLCHCKLRVDLSTGTFNNSGTPAYYNRENKYYKKARNIADTDMYVVVDSRLDAFGGASNPTPFTIAMFGYLDGPADWIVWQLNTVSTKSRLHVWDANCEMEFVFSAYQTKALFKYCIPGGTTCGRLESPVPFQLGKWQNVALTSIKRKFASM